MKIEIDSLQFLHYFECQLKSFYIQRAQRIFDDVYNCTMHEGNKQTINPPLIKNK
jgi:hypothetical protein